MVIPGEDELDRLVLPGDPVEVEDVGKVALRLVREPDWLDGDWRPAEETEQRGRSPC